MDGHSRRILWVDDEIDLLRPHLLFLQDRGYRVDTATNGDDAVALFGRHRYDLVLLDERLPGCSGLEILGRLRQENTHARVIMVTKSEEDATLAEAVGRRVDDYLVKPASPRQVLAAVTRILDGRVLGQRQMAQDFARSFPSLLARRQEARTAADFAALYGELVDWHIRLEGTGEGGLVDSVEALLAELRRDFGHWMRQHYPRWVRGQEERPLTSVDLVRERLIPLLGSRPVLFVVLDCLRLDQWRVISPLLSPFFEVEESLYFSILPTATPYARNALFAGAFPQEIARRFPNWWNLSDDEGSLNNFEDRLLSMQLETLTGRKVPLHYEKVFGHRDEEQIRARVRAAWKAEGTVVALVFNFVDLMTHGRSESPVLMEVARDEAALRDVTRSWFQRSGLFALLQEAAAEGLEVLFTTDHGSILCQRPTTVFARRDATANLRYKFGNDLRVQDPATVFATNNQKDLGFPPARLGMTYLLALEDYFFVYPTKLREYQARYRNAFLHGGISPEEMIVPVARLIPRPR